MDVKSKAISDWSWTVFEQYQPRENEMCWSKSITETNLKLKKLLVYLMLMKIRVTPFTMLLKRFVDLLGIGGKVYTTLYVMWNVIKRL